MQEWYKELINKERLNDWYVGYKETVAKVAGYRTKLIEGYHLSPENDGEFLALFLKNDENGVASKGQSTISHDAYNKLIQHDNFLRTIEELIISPTLESYQEFKQVGDEILVSLKSYRFPLLFNRACASCTLDVSTVVDEIKFDKLLKYLNKQNILKLPEDIKNKNWYERNVFIVNEFRNALDSLIQGNDADYFWINIFLWEVYSAKVATFDAGQAIDFLKNRYPDTQTGTSHIAAFRTPSDRQLALDPNLQTAILICDAEPPKNLNLGIKQHYKVNDPRHHHLSSHAKTLDKGNEAFALVIKSEAELKRFCKWYESGISHPEINSNVSNKEDKNMHPLNQILFGPAGTGKTYHTINHTLSIIENKTLDELKNEEDELEQQEKGSGRSELKKRFDEYKNNGQIQFVTFHQSFSYEDFVEGIRAETDEKGNLTYNVRNGVFKELSQSATIVGVEFKKDHFIQSANVNSIEVKKPNGNIVTFSTKLIEILIENVINKKITIEDISSKNAVNLLEENMYLEPFIVNGYNNLLASLVEYLLIGENQKEYNTRPHILIIDEINRGNISRIFGELITLIEESKRQGNPEELSTTLPYSKESFSVPNNLYIIGTMNSSDRSLTGLDLALRRRFTFIEMAPNPSLLDGVEVDGIQIDRLLDILNKRIEILLDRDHCIGHAYFMPLKDKPEMGLLKEIFLQKIIPLLQEYFFDDWEHIAAVLNDNAMLNPKTVELNKLFNKQRTTNRSIWEINTGAFEISAEYKAIYEGVEEQ